jgi:hypothetical protein
MVGHGLERGFAPLIGRLVVKYKGSVKKVKRIECLGKGRKYSERWILVSYPLRRDEQLVKQNAEL